MARSIFDVVGAVISKELSGLDQCYGCEIIPQYIAQKSESSELVAQFLNLEVGSLYWSSDAFLDIFWGHQLLLATFGLIKYRCRFPRGSMVVVKAAYPSLAVLVGAAGTNSMFFPCV